MRKLIRKWLHALAYAIIRRKGYHSQVIYIEDKLMAAARFATAEAERVGANMEEGGLFKRQAADRMLSNICPTVPAHDRANAIQIAIELVRRA